MKKYYIATRSYTVGRGWGVWSDYGLVRMCFPNCVFENKVDADKKFKKMKREYDDYDSLDIKLATYEESIY